MSVQEPPEEITEAVYFNLLQLEALIIGIPEIIAGCTHRKKLFGGPNRLAHAREIILKAHPEAKLTDEQVLKIADENLALATSILGELPDIIREIKEAHQMLSTTVEKKKQIIVDPEWPPKIHKQ